MVAVPSAPAGGRKRFTIEELTSMVQTGIVRENVELIDGDLVMTPPQQPPHTSVKGRLRLVLESAYRGRAHVRDQDPLAIGKHDQPEPDLVVVPGSPEDYSIFHPRGADAILVVEISASTVEYDRAKAAVYARGSVACYWLVNVDDRTVEEFSAPSRGQYMVIARRNEGDDLVLPDSGERIPVRSLFAPQ